MPRVKPPRTVEQGLWEKPTVLNNVETYANIPMIIKNGADWYSRIGTPQSPGTKAFALTGNVKNTGLIEVPMGISLREIILISEAASKTIKDSSSSDRWSIRWMSGRIPA